MKVRIESGHETATGTAPDDAPTMDERYSLTMFGVPAREVKDDGAFGRWIDPGHVRMDKGWDALAVERERDRRDREQWAIAYGSIMSSSHACEVLRSRDPGALESTS